MIPAMAMPSPPSAKRIFDSDIPPVEVVSVAVAVPSGFAGAAVSVTDMVSAVPCVTTYAIPPMLNNKTPAANRIIKIR